MRYAVLFLLASCASAATSSKCKGSLCRDELLAGLKRADIDACVVRFNKENPDLPVPKRVVVGFAVHADGTPMNASLLSPLAPSLAACVEPAIERWRFASFDGAPMPVTHSFTR